MARNRGDGTIFRRGRIFWIQYYRNGKPHQESSHSEDERKAQRLLRKRLGEIAAGSFVGPAAERLRFRDLQAAVLTDYQLRGHRSLNLARLAFRRLSAWFGEDDRLIDVTPDRIRSYATERLSEDYSPASVNYDLAMLRRGFNLLRRDGKLSMTPYIQLLAAPEPRQGFLEPPDFARLRDALPPALKDPIAFLYLSGWRVGEMRSLEWRDVNIAAQEIRLRPENSKNKATRVLKLAGELLSIFERAHESRRLDCPFVFHLDGHPIGEFRKTWRAACKAAGLESVRVHDLRRSSVRNMVRAGIPERVAMAVSGHKTRTIFDRYNIVSETDLAEAAARVDRFVASREQENARVTPIRAVR